MDTKSSSSFFNYNTPVFMAGIVVVAIFILLAINAAQFLTPTKEGRLSLNEIRGMAIEHNRTLYTLNLAQQMEVAAILNEAIPTTFKHSSGEDSPKNIQTLYIYRFDHSPTLEIIPLGYVNNQLVFTVPAWNPEGEWIETSNGKLKEILSHSYDS